jgi:hypothetical protein
LAEILMIASEQQRAPQEPSSVAIAAIHDDPTGSGWREVEPQVAEAEVMEAQPGDITVIALQRTVVSARVPLGWA